MIGAFTKNRSPSHTGTAEAGGGVPPPGPAPARRRSAEQRRAPAYGGRSSPDPARPAPETVLWSHAPAPARAGRCPTAGGGFRGPGESAASGTSGCRPAREGLMGPARPHFPNAVSAAAAAESAPMSPRRRPAPLPAERGGGGRARRRCRARRRRSAWSSWRRWGRKAGTAESSPGVLGGGARLGGAHGDRGEGGQPWRAGPGRIAPNHRRGPGSFKLGQGEPAEVGSSESRAGRPGRGRPVR